LIDDFRIIFEYHPDSSQGHEPAPECNHRFQLFNLYKNLSIMKKQQIVRGLLMLMLVSFCALGFRSSKKAEIAQPVNPVKSTKLANSAQAAYINPEDMVQGGYYYYWDHGSGAMVAQYDRTENGNIYNFYSITPAQLLYSQNSVISISDAGNITVATLAQIAQLLRSILAGLYVL
jgi:hypothetical protein